MDELSNKQSDEQQNPQSYQQPQYQQPQQFQEPLQTNQGSGFSIASMVLGIVSIVFSCCLWYIALPCGVVGLVLGVLSLRDKKPGRNTAIAGIVMCIVSLALAVVAIIFAGALSAEMQTILDQMQSQMY